MIEEIIRFYYKGRFVKKIILSDDNIDKSIIFINEGGMVRIGNKLINDIEYMNKIRTT